MTPMLGVIEGFFGRPYSWAARRALMEALAPAGYGFYLYAPKADAFLRRRWAEPHPDAEREALAAFAGACRAAGVRFGVGLSPFELHLHPDGDWQAALSAKIADLDAIGVDDLAILFDDMRGDVADLAARQADIVHAAADASRASRLFCCPSYYSDDPILDSAFGARPEDYLETLGARLDPAIAVFWTGEEVCARAFGPRHLDRVAAAIGRKPFLWDNYPVNDGPLMAQHLHLRAFTGRPAGIGLHIAGHGINPASQPVLSQIPALTLAASYAQGDGYDYGAAFDAAAAQVLGPELAARVRKDLIALQDRGLDRLAERRATLRARYAAFDHDGAREIVAWLDGEWALSAELVQTQ